jgi:hypothetical protein
MEDISNGPVQMQVSGWVQVFAAGAFGGALVEILRWWKLRESSNLPAYSRSPFYWAITVAMVLGGGVLAVLYGFDEPRNALMVMNVGASAPALIGALAAAPGEGTSDGGRITRRETTQPAVPGEVGSDDGRTTRRGAAQPAVHRPQELRQFLSFGGRIHDR